MKQLELWKLGMQNVLAASLRSALTVLGMAIGVAAILAVLTLGEAGRVQVKSEIGRLGIDRVIITAAGETPLDTADGKMLGEALSAQVEGLVCLPVKARSGTAVADAVLVGCSSSYLQQVSPAVSQGRMLKPGEWQSAAPAALVGMEAARTLRLAPGNWFSAGGSMLRCVGIVESCYTAAQIDFLHAVIVPVNVLTPWTGSALQELSVQVPAQISPDALAGQAEALLNTAGGKTVNAVSMQVQAEAADAVLDIFMDVLRWVAFICMLVGGIGITNILLVSVRERRREIGIMQSLGATGRQICGLFLCEAMLYALTGGISGLMLGGLLIALAGASIGLTPVVQFTDCLSVFACSLLLGLVSGVAPAARASMLRPIDALREE